MAQWHNGQSKSETTSIHPALSFAAASTFLLLLAYLKPAVHNSIFLSPDLFSMFSLVALFFCGFATLHG